MNNTCENNKHCYRWRNLIDIKNKDYVDGVSCLDCGRGIKFVDIQTDNIAPSTLTPDQKIVNMLEKCLQGGDYTGIEKIIVLLAKRAEYEKQLSYLIK